MKRLKIFIAISIIIGLLLTEAHSVFRIVDSKTASTPMNLFISDKYRTGLPTAWWPSFQWYLKMTFDDLMVIIISFCAAIVAFRISFTIFCLFMVVFVYYAIDIFLFWYNYKSSHATYYVLLVAIIICTLLIVRPVRERAKVRVME